MQNVCRLCLGIISASKVGFNIDEENGLIKNVNTIREMLLFCAPELDIYISYPPVIICESCLPTLVTAYNFKVKCMNTENTIRTFLKKNSIKEGSTIKLRSVVGQIGRLYQTGDTRAGVIKHCVEPKKLTNINQQVLSLLRKPTEKNITSNSTSAANNMTNLKITPKNTPPARIFKTARKRTNPPRQAKEQDLLVVGSGTLDDSSPRTNAAPGSLRQDRRMAYLGLKRKSPGKGEAEKLPENLRLKRKSSNKGEAEKSPEKRMSTNNNDESPNKVIILDDDPAPAVADEAVPKITLTMNNDKKRYLVNNSQRRQSILQQSLEGISQCKPNEKIIRRFNEVTITRKISSDEVLMMNFENEPEICQIDSSDDEHDIEIIEPIHPMIDLIEDNTRKDNVHEKKDDTNKKTESDGKSKVNNESKNKESIVGEKNTKMVLNPCKELSKTENEKKIEASVEGENKTKKSVKDNETSETDTASEKGEINPLQALKTQYQHLIDENPEIAKYFEKELVVKLARMPSKLLKPTKFLVKLKRSKLYSCKYCSYGSLSRKLASDHHLYKHTLKGFYFCKYCDFKSKNLSDLGEHANTNHMPQMVKYLQEHSNEGLYTCTLCKYQGGNILDLRHHRQKQHMKPLANGTVTCPYNCPNYWSTLKEMHKHIEATHEAELQHINAVFHCHVCKYEVNSKPLLSRHLKAHKKSHLLRCLLCPFSTKSQNKMDKHIKNHSDEDIETSSGMVYMEGQAAESSYNDDYRITLDSLRREAHENYEPVPSSSSDFFGGPSLSEMLLVGLSENIEYEDLTESQEPNDPPPEIETICINDNEVVEIMEDEEPHPLQENSVEVEIPSSTSDDRIKIDLNTNSDRKSLVTEKESAITKNDIEIVTKQNDEDCISTTTNCEEFSSERDKPTMSANNDEPETVEKVDSTKLDTIENEDDDVEIVENNENVSKDDDIVPNITKQDDTNDSIDNVTTKLNTSFSSHSEKSNGSCGTSDLSKNVSELEDTIRELNSVLEGTAPTNILYDNKKNIKSDVLDDAFKKSKSIEDQARNSKEEVEQVCNSVLEGTAPTNILHDNEKIIKSDVLRDVLDDQAVNSKEEVEQVCQDATSSMETCENVERFGEEIQEIIKDTSKEFNENCEELAKNISLNVSSSEDKLKALEKRCFLGADVKKISALEERFFKRGPSEGKSTEI